MILHLSMLNRCAAQRVVRFHHFVRRRAILILTAFLANPNVQVIEKSIGIVRLFVGIQHDVRVALVKMAILFFRPRNDFELFNAPNLDTSII